MAQTPEIGHPTEAVPNDLIIAELESALHRATSENIILRARIAARDRRITELEVSAPGPAPADTAAPHERTRA